MAKSKSTHKKQGPNKPEAAQQSGASEIAAPAIGPDAKSEQAPVDGLGNAPEASSRAVQPAASKSRRRTVRRVILVLVCLALLAGGGYWYLVVQAQDVARQEKTLIAAVSKLVVLPVDEVPAVSTVVDEKKVDQEFLRNAKKGDKVLLYFQAGRAVVYRPSTQQIVNVGPLETPKPRVFLRSGSQENRLDNVADRLAQSPDFAVASRDESPKKDYQKTLVVDIAGNRPDIARRLAQLLNATVVPLPENESKPDADMLVIVGGNWQPN